MLGAYIAILVGAGTCYGQDYQKIADVTAWSWSAERASVGYSFLKFPNTYQVELIRKKNKYGEVTIRLLDDGKELVAWEHRQHAANHDDGERQGGDQK
jgi:hypothetical protein